MFKINLSFFLGFNKLFKYKQDLNFVKTICSTSYNFFALLKNYAFLKKFLVYYIRYLKIT